MSTLLEMVVEGQRDVEAAEALGMLAESTLAADTIVDAMKDVLDKTDDVPIQLRITQALAEIPGAAARNALAELTRDGDRTIASTARAILSTNDRRRRIK